MTIADIFALIFMAFIGGVVLALEIATAITRRERVMMERVITIMEIATKTDKTEESDN